MISKDAHCDFKNAHSDLQRFNHLPNVVVGWSRVLSL